MNMRIADTRFKAGHSALTENACLGLPASVTSRLEHRGHEAHREGSPKCFRGGLEFQPRSFKDDGDWQSPRDSIAEGADWSGFGPFESDSTGVIVLLIVSPDKRHVGKILSNLVCEKGFNALGKCIDDPSLIESVIEQVKPDQLLFDMELLPALSFSLAQKIRAKNPKIKFILLSGKTSPELTEGVAAPYIDGYLPIDAPSLTYIKAINAVNHGEYWLPRWMIVSKYEYLLQDMREQLAVQGLEKPESIYRSLLTERELQICELVVKGHTNKEIAKTLAVSAETVKKHLTNICAKWGVRRRSELATLFSKF